MDEIQITNDDIVNKRYDKEALHRIFNSRFTFSAHYIHVADLRKRDIPREYFSWPSLFEPFLDESGGAVIKCDQDSDLLGRIIPVQLKGIGYAVWENIPDTSETHIYPQIKIVYSFSDIHSLEERANVKRFTREVSDTAFGLLGMRDRYETDECIRENFFVGLHRHVPEYDRNVGRLHNITLEKMIDKLYRLFDNDNPRLVNVSSSPALIKK